jgi:hypothetical protein
MWQYANSDAFVGNFVENLREGWGVYTAGEWATFATSGGDIALYSCPYASPLSVWAHPHERETEIVISSLSQ